MAWFLALQGPIPHPPPVVGFTSFKDGVDTEKIAPGASQFPRLWTGLCPFPAVLVREQASAP